MRVPFVVVDVVVVVVIVFVTMSSICVLLDLNAVKLDELFNERPCGGLAVVVAVVVAAREVARVGFGRGNTNVPSRAMGASRGSVGCTRNRLGSGSGSVHGGGAVVVESGVGVDSGVVGLSG